VTALVEDRFRLARPALALWRQPGVLQVGLDAPSLVLEGVPPALAAAVPLLATPCTAAELHALLPDLDEGWVPWLVERLAEAGLLRAAEPAAEPALTVVGAGALAEAVARSLQEVGVAATQCDAVEFAGLPSPAGPSLVLLAGSTAEPDRGITDTLFREGRAHLVVRLEPDRAVVGPFVRPGHTPCIRCLDLSSVHLDRGWPHLLAQLCRHSVDPDASLLAWAGCTAAVQARAWLAGGMPETCGGSLELSLPDYRLRSRAWSAHPACGCLLTPG
jgi:hypothetical protein